MFRDKALLKGEDEDSHVPEVAVLFIFGPANAVFPQCLHIYGPLYLLLPSFHQPL